MIEILVVIAIISLIAAMLFPAFASAREKSRQSVCASNERQIGLGYLQYIQDYDETVPEPRGWTGFVYPYFQNVGVFKCPDDTARATVSYMVNATLSGNPNDRAPDAVNFGNVANWTAPASTVMAAECKDQSLPLHPEAYNTEAPRLLTDVGGPDPNWGRGAAGALGRRPIEPSFVDGPNGRHTKGSNFLLCDGHIKWLRGEQVSSGYQVNTLPICNQDNTPAVQGCMSVNDPNHTYIAGTEGTFGDGSHPAATLSPL